MRRRAEDSLVLHVVIFVMVGAIVAAAWGIAMASILGGAL
jgi:hypothetical protein